MTSYKLTISTADRVLLVVLTGLVMIMCFVLGTSLAWETLRLRPGLARFVCVQSSILAGFAYGGFWLYMLQQHARSWRIALVTGSLAFVTTMTPILLLR
jgi:hypothetical protein